jgi:hypothetical protein
LLLWLKRNGGVFLNVCCSLVALVHQVWELVEVWVRAGKVVRSQLFGE